MVELAAEVVVVTQTISTFNLLVIKTLEMIMKISPKQLLLLMKTLVKQLLQLMKTSAKLLLLLFAVEIDAEEVVVVLQKTPEDIKAKLLTKKDKVNNHNHSLNKLTNGTNRKINNLKMNSVVTAEAEVEAEAIDLDQFKALTINIKSPITNATISIIIDNHMVNKKKVKDLIKMQTNIVKTTNTIPLLIEEEIVVLIEVE